MVQGRDDSRFALEPFCELLPGNLDGDLAAQAFDDPSAFALDDEFCIESKPSTYALAGERPRLTTNELWAQFAPPEA